MANPNTLSSAPETANPVPRELDAAAKNPDNTKLLADARQAAGQELDAGATAAEKPPYTTAEAAIGFADVTALKVRYGVTVTGNAVTIDGDRHVWLDGKPANI